MVYSLLKKLKKGDIFPKIPPGFNFPWVHIAIVVYY